MQHESLSVLQSLPAAPSASGFEQPAQQAVRDYVTTKES